MKVFVCFPELFASECFHPTLMNCIFNCMILEIGQKAGLNCKSEWDEDFPTWLDLANFGYLFHAWVRETNVHESYLCLYRCFHLTFLAAASDSSLQWPTDRT